jgi:hypothetical protein
VKGVLPQVSGEKEFFANLVVDAVSKLDPQTLDLRMIGIKKVGRLRPRNSAIQIWEQCRSSARNHLVCSLDKRDPFSYSVSCMMMATVVAV